jgi:hypothetical protein
MCLFNTDAFAFKTKNCILLTRMHGNINALLIIKPYEGISLHK